MSALSTEGIEGLAHMLVQESNGTLLFTCKRMPFFLKQKCGTEQVEKINVSSLWNSISFSPACAYHRAFRDESRKFSTKGEKKVNFISLSIMSYLFWIALVLILIKLQGKKTKNQKTTTYNI